jgi:hypothetical protein
MLQYHKICMLDFHFLEIQVHYFIQSLSIFSMVNLSAYMDFLYSVYFCLRALIVTISVDNDGPDGNF